MQGKAFPTSALNISDSTSVHTKIPIFAKFESKKRACLFNQSKVALSLDFSFFAYHK